jgi:hypothetical protein
MIPIRILKRPFGAVLLRNPELLAGKAGNSVGVFRVVGHAASSWLRWFCQQVFDRSDHGMDANRLRILAGTNQ